ncbi:Putative ribonuclease H protein At1g65750 [Linum perenne]
MAKEDGGLGLKLAKELNRAYLTKLAFLLLQDLGKLWVRVLQNKYFHESEDGFILKKLSSQSSIWKGISREWGIMTKGARIAIRDGRSTNLWSARWVDNGCRLIDLVEDGAAEFDVEVVVVDFVNLDGQWNFDKLRTVLPSAVVELVAGLTPPRDDQGEDLWMWGGEKATAGGILRDHIGKFILAFSMNLGSCSVTRAEMRGALEGLRRTCEAGFRKVSRYISMVWRPLNSGNSARETGWWRSDTHIEKVITLRITLLRLVTTTLCGVTRF